jgi:cyclophilin family peptidyl-prolyl cis-trans isomerase
MHNLQPEFNDTKHVKGIVSMARGEALDSATTSFFICTGRRPALDGQYTAFGASSTACRRSRRSRRRLATGRRRRRGLSSERCGSRKDRD